MGSSNMDVVTTSNCDIEDQLHNPKWFVDHTHMLRPNQEEEANKLGYAILKVPEYRRQPLRLFIPRGWRFGLHNRENLDINGSEAVKLVIAVQFGLVGEKWIHFRNAIVDDPKAILACYGLLNGVTTWIDEHIKHVLALDALFLATYIDMGFPRNEGRLCKLPSWSNVEDVIYARDKSHTNWMGFVLLDLHQVENQIPFVLIDKVVDYLTTSIASSTSQGSEPFINDSLYQQRKLEIVAHGVSDCFMITSSEAFKIDDSFLLDEKTHILGATYKTICGSKDRFRNQMVYRDEYIHVPSATKLEQSGIKFVGVGGPLCTMSYNKKCLSLPKMRIFDGTFSFIRNMAWYEYKSISRGCLFHDYIHFMSDLIQDREDMDLLVNQDVIYNTCGNKGFEMWTALKEGLIQIPSSEIHHKMKEDIESRCRLRRYRLWSEFKIVFCSKPWVVLSTIAVVLVTMATLIQTYIAIIGSNKMKPKFP